MADTHHCQIKLRRELSAARPKKLASGVSVRNAMFVASSEEKPESELTRLRKEQNKARHDEARR
jgi:hypothetical protein